LRNNGTPRKSARTPEVGGEIPKRRNETKRAAVKIKARNTATGKWSAQKLKSKTIQPKSGEETKKGGKIDVAGTVMAK